MQYVDRTFANFDPAKPLVAARRMTLMGEEVNRGDDIDLEAIPQEVRRRLWMTRHVDYKTDFRPTPELETKGEGREWMDEKDGVTVTEGENGWYTITASWLGEDGEKVRGAEAAEARAVEVRELGDTKGVTYAHSGGGWYLVSAPWLDEPVKVKGEEAAKAEFEKLRKSQKEPELEPVSELAAQVVINVEDEEYLVSAPWLDGAERFADVTAAEDRQKALREAGPPEGWTPSADDATGE